jgi:hypothetical protein
LLGVLEVGNHTSQHGVFSLSLNEKEEKKKEEDVTF